MVTKGKNSSREAVMLVGKKHENIRNTSVSEYGGIGIILKKKATDGGDKIQL